MAGSKKDAIAATIDNIEFLRSEILKFLRMPREELVSFYREASSDDDFVPFYRFPNSTKKPRTYFYCGPEAYKRVRKSVRDFFERQSGSEKVTFDSFFDHATLLVANFFLSGNRPVDRANVQTALARALNRAIAECRDSTHYIPLHLVTNKEPEQFLIGPVRFVLRESALKNLSADFENYLSSPYKIDGEIAYDPQRRQDHLSFALEFWDNFQWISEVTIPDCSPSISEKRARQCVQSALDSLHVFLGETASRNFRIAGSEWSERKSITVTKLHNSLLNISWSVNWPIKPFSDNWWDSLVDKAEPRRLEVIGRGLEIMASGNTLPPLYQRVIDALTWFGQGARETENAVKIVKYVIAVERMVQCKSAEEADSTERFSERVGTLCSMFEGWSFEEWAEKAREGYRARSSLVHGSISPSDARLRRSASIAEEVAQGVIVGALDFFQFLGLESQDWKADTLNNAFEDLVARQRSLQSPH